MILDINFLCLFINYKILKIHLQKILFNYINLDFLLILLYLVSLNKSNNKKFYIQLIIGKLLVVF